MYRKILGRVVGVDHFDAFIFCRGHSKNGLPAAEAKSLAESCKSIRSKNSHTLIII